VRRGNQFPGVAPWQEVSSATKRKNRGETHEKSIALDPHADNCRIAPQIAAMDLFVVPTIGFNLLYALIIVRLARRELVWVNVTAHPTAEWIARQITEAFPWNEAPRYLIRDRDA
jgi:hypothetical protein